MKLKQLNCFLMLLLVSALMTGCATPSNYSSMPWETDSASLYVTPVSDSRFQVDNYVTTREGLKVLFEHQIAMGLAPEVVIDAPLKFNYQAQAQIAMLAEELGLTVYQRGFLVNTGTDSQTLIERAKFFDSLF